VISLYEAQNSVVEINLCLVSKLKLRKFWNKEQTPTQTMSVLSLNYGSEIK